MGIFTKNPPTATDLVEEDEKKVGLDPSSEEVEQTASGQAHHVHPDIEKRVIRKMDLRIVSLVTALYVLAFLDRSNIGNAKVAGMQKALDLGGNRYQWLLTIFCELRYSTCFSFKLALEGATGCFNWVNTYGGCHCSGAFPCSVHTFCFKPQIIKQ